MVGHRLSTAGPWNGSWNGRPRNSSATSAPGAICRVICAGHAISAREHASRNAPLTGSSGRTGALRHYRSSLGYEPYDARRYRLKQSLVSALTSINLRHEVAVGPVRLPRLRLSRRVRFTNPFTDMGHRPERKQTSTAPAGDQCRCALRRPEFLAVSRASLVRHPIRPLSVDLLRHPRSSRAYPVRTATGLFVIAPTAVA